MAVALPARRRRALITGITGQDGSYLTEPLLSKDHEEHGIKLRSSGFNTERVHPLISDWHEPNIRYFLHFGDLSDAISLSKLPYRLAPDEIDLLGVQSHVRVSLDIPEFTGDSTALGTSRLLDAIGESGSPARFCTAANSEMFGPAHERLQTESAPFRPRSRQACAKPYILEVDP
jgi:GDPmannose 4,6-dehydratase